MDSYIDNAASSLVAFLSGVPATWDVVILLLLFGFVFLYGVSFGLRRIFGLIVGTYIAFAIFSIFPFFDKVFGRRSGIEGSMILFIFAATVLVATFIIARHFSRSSSGSWLKVAAVALLEVGLLATLLFQLLDYPKALDVTPWVRKLFTHELGVLAW